MSITENTTEMELNQRTISRFAILTILICLLLALCSCSSSKKVNKVEKEYIHDSLYIEKRYVDTIVEVEADTALIRMFAECDENNNVLIHKLGALQGERMNVTPEIRYVKVRDTLTNEVRTKAYLDVVATTQKLQNHIKILEERLTHEKDINRQLNEEVSKHRNSYYGLGFIIILVIIVVLYLIRKVR